MWTTVHVHRISYFSFFLVIEIIYSPWKQDKECKMIFYFTSRIKNTNKYKENKKIVERGWCGSYTLLAPGKTTEEDFKLPHYSYHWLSLSQYKMWSMEVEAEWIWIHVTLHVQPHQKYCPGADPAGGRPPPPPPQLRERWDTTPVTKISGKEVLFTHQSSPARSTQKSGPYWLYTSDLRGCFQKEGTCICIP